MPPILRKAVRLGQGQAWLLRLADQVGNRVSQNGAIGMSDIEGKAAREVVSECGQRMNGAAGTRAT
jgi:hypothetical protein